MGEHRITNTPSELESQMFLRSLLNDLTALERMLAGTSFDTTARIGAEQEMFLVDRTFRPAPVNVDVLAHGLDARLTTEIGRFNLEANLTPLDFKGRCFHQLERELHEVVDAARRAARLSNADILLAGILPTIRVDDLSIDNLTPHPRYQELNRTVLALRHGEFHAHIKGLDELDLAHPNVMLEACCTSFQVHLQVPPADFARLYNWAQVITAPVLAAAVNSPILLGHRLWQETRIALFQHSVDERSAARQRRDAPTRVSFGEDWVNDSVLDIFREEVARFRVIFTRVIDEDSLDLLDRGEIPSLAALKLHNGTVWRWNRPCYGVHAGRPHLRIEFRAFPSGPTLADETANAAFAFGLVRSFAEEKTEVRRRISFDELRQNFLTAARSGLQCQLHWLDGRTWPAGVLIREELLPRARHGLDLAGVDPADRDHYLGIIHDRVERDQTGSTWALRSLAQMHGRATREQRYQALAAAMIRHQQTNTPVHQWPLASIEEQRDAHAVKIADIMSTDLFTVRPDDLIDLAANLMDWRHVRHVPVENNEGQLLGILSHRDLLHQLCTDPKQRPAVSTLMKTKVITVTPDTPALDGLRLLVDHRIGCLPVTNEHGALLGIVTASDFLRLAASVLS